MDAEGAGRGGTVGESPADAVIMDPWDKPKYDVLKGNDRFTPRQRRVNPVAMKRRDEKARPGLPERA